jgi:chromosome segregation ATPase
MSDMPLAGRALAGMQQQLNDTRAELATATARLAEVERERDALQRDIDGMAFCHEWEERRAGKAEADLVAMQSDLTAMTQERDRMVDARMALGNDLMAQLTAARARIEAVEAALREARVHVEVSRGDSQQQAELYKGYPRASRYQDEIDEATALLASIDALLATPPATGHDAGWEVGR